MTQAQITSKYGAHDQDKKTPDQLVDDLYQEIVRLNVSLEEKRAIIETTANSIREQCILLGLSVSSIF